MKPEEESRIDLGVMKVQIVKRLGIDKAKRYFYYLNRLLSQKINKNEFNKLSIRVLGKENIGLHNQLISSVLKNAYHAKIPPPKKEVAHIGKCSFHVESQTQTLKCDPASPPQTHSLPNGVILPLKFKSEICDGKVGPNGNVDQSQTVAMEDDAIKIVPENGESAHPEQIKSQSEALVQDKGVVEGSAKVMKEENIDKFTISRYPLLPPLGISCGVCKAMPVASPSNSTSFFDMGFLADTETLRGRMAQIAVVHGVEGVSMDCANALNNMLDLYLKRLISSCSGIEPRNKSMQIQPKLVNGMRPANHFHTGRRNLSISLLDLSVAMQLNPQQLGENWPLLLEKINMRLFEE